ncbi:MAG: hypothetical protein EXS41_04665 [Opitutaceae bacterium]|nr:hypothetical protein [Opitutaceae bacterium]
MNFRPLILFVTILGVAGCESLSEATSSVRDRMAAREAPKVKTFAAEPRATYEAVRTAATQMGYRFQRGGPAQDEYEAVSGVGAGDRPGTARQLAMKVRLSRALEGATEVSIQITEIIEADSSNRAGVATAAPLRDTPQYEVFFERVGQVLGVPAQGGTSRRLP